jgi:hypothetical protein
MRYPYLKSGLRRLERELVLENDDMEKLKPVLRALHGYGLRAMVAAQQRRGCFWVLSEHVMCRAISDGAINELGGEALTALRALEDNDQARVHQILAVADDVPLDVKGLAVGNLCVIVVHSRELIDHSDKKNPVHFAHYSQIIAAWQPLTDDEMAALACLADGA